jgi:CheY-like chemotaxis protein
LIVEDNLINQKVASAMVRKMGHTFKIASNGQEALQILQQENFDLILMDAQMPLMDGYEATRRIRKGDAGVENQKIPILAVTANAIKGDLEMCLEAGMNDYISKPISQGDLHMKLEKWLRTGVHAIDSEAIKRLQDLEDDNNQDLVKDLIQIFIDTSPEVIKNLKKSLQEENFQALSRQAHSFKSTCNNIGATRMGSIAAQLEKAKSQDDLTTLHKLVDALNEEYQVAVQELKRYEAA